MLGTLSMTSNLLTNFVYSVLLLTIEQCFLADL